MIPTTTCQRRTHLVTSEEIITDLDMITLNFDGFDDYIQIADDARFSVATTGGLTVAAWMRPEVLAFPNFESTGYVHWLGI